MANEFFEESRRKAAGGKQNLSAGFEKAAEKMLDLLGRRRRSFDLRPAYRECEFRETREADTPPSKVRRALDG